jgi:hypothetical protein
MRDEMGKPRPTEIGTREAKVKAAPELMERGDWLCVNVETSCPWPVYPQPFEFAGHVMWIVPLTQEEYGGVAMMVPKELSREEAEGLLLRFLSVLSWRERSGIAVAHRSGGSMPFMMGLNKKIGFAIREEFDLTELLCPEEERPRIALALMREALSLNNHGYSFLSCWRVLELAYPVTKDRVAWMQSTVPSLKGPGIQEALESIAESDVAAVCKHLFESGRCAVAHASGTPIINPDDPRDALRLYRELPLLRKLAEKAIEDGFGIPTRSTEFAQHLYELRGWKKVFGDDLVCRLLCGAGPLEGEQVDMPSISVRLRQRPPYMPMENMEIAGLDVQDAIIKVAYKSADGLFEIRFQLDFGEERLLFAIDDGIYGRDDGSVAAAEYRREFHRFLRDYFLNGELLILNSDTGEILSRKDAFLPRNCYVELGCVLKYGIPLRGVA